MRNLLVTLTIFISSLVHAGNLSTLIKGSGGSVNVSCSAEGVAYSVGGNPSFCKAHFTTNGYQVETTVNTGKPCAPGKICLDGECKTGSDPCSNGTATPGSVCITGTYYIGEFNGYRYMTTPYNCNGATIYPECGVGEVQASKPVFLWSSASTGNGSNTLIGANSTTDGLANTKLLVQNYADASAAHYCNDLVYGGYSDWFLPSLRETDLLVNLQNQLGLTYINNSIWYHYFIPLSTSTEANDSQYYFRSKSPIANGSSLTGPWSDSLASKVSSSVTRCVRKYQ